MKNQLKPKNLSDFSSALSLGQGYEWQLDRNAHMSISGLTGSGKTYLIYLLLLQARRASPLNEIFIIDGKAGTLSSFENYFSEVGHVATSPVQAVEMLRKTVTLMERRFQELRETATGLEATARDLGCGDVFVFIDELSALMLMARQQDLEAKALNKEHAKDRSWKRQPEGTASEIIKLLQQIVYLGRQAIVHIILSAQVQSAEVLGSTDIRSQLSIRILLGRPTREHIQMYGFSKDEIPLVDYSEAGSGMIWIDGMGWATPKPYLVPTLRLSRDVREVYKDMEKQR